VLALLSVWSEVQNCVIPSAAGISGAGACRDVDAWCVCGVCCWVPAAVGGSAPPTAAAEVPESGSIVPLPGKATVGGFHVRLWCQYLQSHWKMDRGGYGLSWFLTIFLL